MTCREAESMVMPYINYQLDTDEMEDFLKHVESCDECMEELEIYFTVDAGIRQLDNETGIYNIKGEMKNTIAASWKQIQARRRLQICRYAIKTLEILSVLLMIALQLRIWWQNGFLF